MYIFETINTILLVIVSIRSLLFTLSKYFSDKRGIDFGLGRGYSGSQVNNCECCWHWCYESGSFVYGRSGADFSS